MKHFRRKATAVLVSASAALTLMPGLSASAESSDSEWQFTFFGTSVNKNYNKLTAGGFASGTVSLGSATFKDDGSIDKKGGKFVADSPADGGSYYYTTIDPTKQNFVLQADVTIDQMNPKPDGQEGFALMVRDKVWDTGTGGSCMADLVSVGATKLPLNGDVKDGIGIRAYTGIYTSEASDENTIKATRAAFTKDTVKQGETYRVRLEKTDNAYITTQYNTETNDVIGTYTYYIPAKDSSATAVVSYDELEDPMTFQEKDKAYVAFVVARGINATFSNITFTTSDWDASKWVPQPIQEVDATLSILSGTTTAGGQYELMFRTNADGTAKVYHGEELIASDISVTANSVVSDVYPLAESKADFTVKFTPKEGYAVSTFEKIASTDEISKSVSVSQRTLGKDGKLYVSAEGKSTNEGTSFDDAVDLQTALDYARPGLTVVLRSETYNVESTLTIARGRNGSADSPITMTTDDGKFALIDFGGKGSGFNVWGDYWNFSKINICNSKGKGMQLYGSHNTVEQMNFWNNGNSGLQIAGSSADDKSVWPAYNTVINCTSVNNADKSLEDADGFAAKLTSGEGNVFDGCIAAYNADDGWDLFAKIATGQIGAVEIKNCVTYKNGYIMVTEGSTAKEFTLVTVTCDDKGNLTFDGGVEMEAGNGNGFKMGGSNIPGAHKLSNSISFDNKAKGIDSNSCPDIKISNSVSYNNGGANVALYTGNAAAVTDYSASGIVSYRKDTSVKENIKLQEQDKAAVYGSTNFYWDEETNTSVNTNGTAVTDDWFVKLDTSAVPTRTVDGFIDMNGLLELKTADVAFDADGGSEVTGQKVTLGQPAEKPAAPTKAGYTFKFWSVDGTTEYGFTEAVTEGITLKAVWEAAPAAVEDTASAVDAGNETNPATGAPFTGMGMFAALSFLAAAAAYTAKNKKK